MAENYTFKSERGLSKKIVEQISEMKGEPPWMRQFRLKSLTLFEQRPMPTWGADLSGIDFDTIYYYIKPVAQQGKTWTTSQQTLRTPLIDWVFRKLSRSTWPA